MYLIVSQRLLQAAGLLFACAAASTDANAHMYFPAAASPYTLFISYACTTIQGARAPRIKPMLASATSHQSLQ